MTVTRRQKKFLMPLSGSVTIKAPRRKVWDFLTDPQKAGQCAPGVESVEVIVPGQKFRATVAIGFGAMKARFTGEAEWLELEPPNRAKIKAHGATPGSAADVTCEMILSDGPAGATEMKWTAEPVIMGQLASLAARMMTPVSQKLTEQFYESVKKMIEQRTLVVRSEMRPGAYYDSAVLMQLQRALSGLPDVADAGVMMATPANLELLDQSGLLTDDAKKAGPNDLLIVVKAESESSALGALTQVDALLARRRAAVVEEFRPKSLETAVQQLPEAGWVLVSVPGRFATGVAQAALNLNRHVFLYSDNVSLADEIELKKMAQSKGLLVMGPDCGTAIINGVGLGFANRVRRGAIGLVGASGTGLQAITSRIHTLGGGVSHAIGTGGRDLKSEVGAITAHQALDVLARDPETTVVVLVSKPPAPNVTTKLLAAAQATGKPVVVDFIGYPPPARRLGNLHFAASLSEAAEVAVELLEIRDWRLDNLQSPISNLYLRGLFSGGTLAYETMLGLQAVLSPIFSNAPISESQKLPDPLKSQAHTIVDLGDEVFMVGRLHPMIDNDLRLRRLRQEAADPEVGLILLDVVLGEGAHPDPASELAPAIREIRDQRSEIEVVAVVIGTEDDPQNLSSQVERLEAAGAVVFRSATEAIDYVARRLSPRPAAIHPPVALDRFTQTPLAAINVGLESFYASLVGQGATAVHVDWRPPAGGNEKLAAILAKMKKRD
jgi:FdrA protein